MLFSELGLIEPLQKAVAHEGYKTPTPIQEQAIPVVLAGRDILGCAQTGTGKTASFVLPLLQRMHEQKETHGIKGHPLKTLILTPTRELATQIHESIENYGRFLNLKSVVIFGGVSQSRQVSDLRRGCDFIVATPGRLMDLMNQNYIVLNGIEYLVLDEADRMLDMGFVHEVKRIIARIPKKRQTLFFSATMPPAIQSLVQVLLSNPVSITVTPEATTAELVDQKLYYVQKSEKRALLHHILKNSPRESVLVFTRTKHGADRVARDLNHAGFQATAIHGDKTQQARERSLQGFKDGKMHILVATDIAARGIDIDDLGLVVNFDLPNIPESYVHRIGRTGRAGAFGKAISFCDYEEKIYLKDIQKFIGQTVPVESNHPYHVALMEPLTVASSSAASSSGRSMGGGRRYGRKFSQR
ncbi:MAG: DEAD/DEAH box helicase [Bacteroidota bacterium]|nr:DEAD/DEAH box helicase [Bacteroidota bacterium]